MSDSDFGAIAELVPQTSYEIVGRIIPGLVVMLSLIMVARGPTQALMDLDEAVVHPGPALSVWDVVLMIIGAYILAFVLDGVWQIPACIRRRRRGKPYQPDLQAPSTSLKFDMLNQELPKAGAWLTKLYAETNTTQVLMIGWVVSATINIYFLLTDFSFERLWLELGLIAGTIGVAACRDSIMTTREKSLENLWLLLREPRSVRQAGRTAEKEKHR